MATPMTHVVVYTDKHIIEHPVLSHVRVINYIFSKSYV